MLKDEDILLIRHAQTDMQLTILFMPAISTGMANEVQPPVQNTENPKSKYAVH